MFVACTWELIPTPTTVLASALILRDRNNHRNDFQLFFGHGSQLFFRHNFGGFIVIEIGHTCVGPIASRYANRRAF